MSWNPFKKAFSGRRTRTEDVDFEKEMNQLRQMRAVVKKLYRDMAKCNEIEHGQSRAQQHILTDMKTSSTAKQDPIKELVEVLASILDSEHIHSRELRTDQDVVFIDPMKKLSDIIKKVEIYSKQREQKLQEYERQQNRLDKQERKATAHGQVNSSQSSRVELSQLTSQLSRARMDYERVHERLMQEVPQLVHIKSDYLDICLMAIVWAQVLYYEGCRDAIREGVVKESEVGVTPDSPPSWYMKDRDIQDKTTQYLDSIRNLSIVGNTLMN